MLISDREMHLRDYLKVVSKRRGAVTTFFGATFLLVLLATFAATPLYEGKTRIVIEKVQPSDLTGRGRADSMDPEFYETQYQLLKSRAVAYRVMAMLSLEENYDAYRQESRKSASGLQSLWLWTKDLKNQLATFLKIRKPDGEPSAQPSKKEWIADQLLENLKVRPLENSRIVSIIYESPNPELAALVPNATVKAYVEETLEMKMESSRRTLEWMSKKAEVERAKLENAEQNLQAYMGANNILTVEDRVAVVPEQLSEISSQLVRAESKRKELEILYQKVKGVSGDTDLAETVAAIASDTTLQALRAQIVEAEKSIMELSGKFGQKHPVMIKARGDLQVLRRKRSHEVARIIESIKNEYELAVSVEAGLRDQLAKTKSEALVLNEKFIQYGALKREVDTNRQMFDALLLRMKEQSITEENQAADLWIVEEAKAPGKPAKPWKGVNLLLGSILGLFGGVGLAFFLEYLDNTIKNPEEAEAGLGAAVLGIVPLCHDRHPIEEVVLKEPRSAFAESYKALRTALLLSSADSPPGKILITSSLPGEGKTTTSVNLAVALAQSEHRVLLIDGDLRKPRIHKIFRLTNQKGLSTYLAGTTGGDILEKGPLANLTVIPAGPIAPNPSELLASSRMKKLLDTLKQEFDIIICDSPPVLSVADARILSRFFEGTVLVTRAGQTTYEVAKKTLKILHDINAPVLGLMINSLDHKEGEDYYNAYYAAPEPAQKGSMAGERIA
ncbi:chain-length determining protein [Desulfuromonas versatilis]|uniref:non-specific protein-tyrosine kinase n=1 Tax=Desulfuromonas versatilis TaxID=2802975 RepID=A0ABN6E0S2_9BACT|nr:polysaccharide biosynthesis tyrosine autokinase [Desulfuromonas versatilis]BCR05782.1 chain-length determining protein [Desulfuromonas versatilis]